MGLAQADPDVTFNDHVEMVAVFAFTDNDLSRFDSDVFQVRCDDHAVRFHHVGKEEDVSEGADDVGFSEIGLTFDLRNLHRNHADVIGGPFEQYKVPKTFNWHLWQGQTPDTAYIPERAHYYFRWWYEYSGGQMTDWGAHHLDIAQWGINSLPIEIKGTATYPDVGSDSYNVSTDYSAEYKYANGVTMTVSDTGRNGIMFTGTEGRIFVNRGTISGTPVEELAQKPLERDQWTDYDFDNHDRPLRAGKHDAIINHMGNFFDCIQERKSPISDVESQHRSVTTCHLGNIAQRLGRPVQWDPDTESFPNDEEATTLMSREQRQGFEVI